LISLSALRINNFFAKIDIYVRLKGNLLIVFIG
jgi:hypothetical protein